jgi:multiple sugar transport system permease protein
VCTGKEGIFLSPPSLGSIPARTDLSMAKPLIGSSTKKNLYFYYLILPTMVILVLMNIYPLLYSLSISLTDFNLASSTKRTFLGLMNYAQLFRDSFFYNSFFNTGKFVILSLILELLVGFLVSLLLYYLRGLGRAFLTIFLLPMMLTPIIVGLMWRFMMNYDVGLVNYLLTLVGIKREAFLADRSTALFVVILVDVWQWTPFIVLLTYSSMQSIPLEPFEAARIDGASELQVIRYIIVPALRNAIILCLLIRGMDAIREYDKIFTMTAGGPGNATETLSFYIYRQGFKLFNLGYAAAASYILLIVTTLLAQFLLGKLQKAVK